MSSGVRMFLLVIGVIVGAINAVPDPPTLEEQVRSLQTLVATLSGEIEDLTQRNGVSERNWSNN